MWSTSRLARQRKAPVGFIEPCLPTSASQVPHGPQWLHEVKYDGYRIIARKDGG
jgi:bifunctional non-homologous end joining protein LigD